MSAIIEINQLSKTFGSGDSQVAALKDVSLSVEKGEIFGINGNYALGAGLNVGKDALASEDAASVSATTYANILCVKAGNEETAKTKALIKALSSAAVKEYIEKNYTGAVVPLT